MRVVLAGSLLLSALIPHQADATGIPDLPGLLDVNVCFSRPDESWCGGALRSQLAAPPHYVDTYVSFGPTGEVRVGLVGPEGAWEANDGQYLLGLYLPPDSHPGVSYPLDAVFLFFDSGQANRWVAPSSIFAADVVYRPGYGPDDLSRLLEAPSGGAPPHNPIELTSGFLVFSFSAIPEPTTLALVGAGLVALSRASRATRTR